MKSLKAVSTVTTTYGCFDSDEESDSSDFEDLYEESEPTQSISHSMITANSGKRLAKRKSDQRSPFFLL